ncbi:MAG: hypothetical protein OEU33_12115 [Chromatiales bacterium]|nr:hypothetical protein [Chromatiales bacterium]
MATMIAGDQLLWGRDDWPHLERYLRGEDPLAADDLDPWLRVTQSAAPPPSVTGKARVSLQLIGRTYPIMGKNKHFE